MAALLASSIAVLILTVNSGACVNRTTNDLQPLGYVARVCNRVGLSVYKDAAQGSNDNVILSPFSICSVLASCYRSTEGSSRYEIVRRLFLQLIYPEEVFPVFRQAYRSFAEDPHVNVSSSNILLVNRLYQLNSETVRDFTESLNGTVVGYDDTNSVVAANRINAILSSVMNTADDYNFGADDMDSEKALYFINALRVSARWESQFAKGNTAPDPFYPEGGSPVSVPFMYQRGYYRFRDIRGLGVMVLEMPYEGGRFAMYIVLPNERGRLQKIEKKLRYRKFEKLLATMTRKSTFDLYLPKFSTSLSMSIKGSLEKMGITKIFDSEKANFDGLIQGSSIYVSKAVHESAITVDEQGTVAGSYTVMKAIQHSTAPMFVANHPFLYVLRDTRSGFNLFMGRYSKPDSSS